MHRSLLKRFPLFGFCLVVSSVPNFRPDTGGWRWSMFGFASSVVLRGEGVLFSRLRCSGSRLLCMERALHCLRFQPSGPPQKHGLLRLRFAPSPPERLRQPGACRAPSPLRGPSPSPRPRRSGACAPCLAATLPADVDHPESQEVFG